MKVPASIADLAIAGAVWWWFRDRPRLALLGVGAVLLWPATWYVSAWWGQYEPIYVLPAVLALLAARAGRPGLVAALLAVSLMTKPQALPFIVPFAAWFLATQGWRGTLRAGAIGALVAAATWLPFLATGGPVNYLNNLQTYQNDIFSVLSLRAWNPWWLLQELGAGGAFVSDTTKVLGPLTFRHLGFLMAGMLGVVVFAGVYRRPSAENLALGLAAITLVAFVSLTTMHERYAYPAFVFLLLAVPRPVVAITLGRVRHRLRAQPGGRRAARGLGDPGSAADRDPGRRGDDGDRPRHCRGRGACGAGSRVPDRGIGSAVPRSDSRQGAAASSPNRRRIGAGRIPDAMTASTITTAGAMSTRGNARAAATRRRCRIAGSAMAT